MMKPEMSVKLDDINIFENHNKDISIIFFGVVEIDSLIIGPIYSTQLTKSSSIYYYLRFLFLSSIHKTNNGRADHTFYGAKNYLK